MRRFIHLSTCGCKICKGRAAVCIAGFGWLKRDDPLHALENARKDLLRYLIRPPPRSRTRSTRPTSTCAPGVPKFGLMNTAHSKPSSLFAMSGSRSMIHAAPPRPLMALA